MFSIGFFARPLGGILLGHIGDRYGRKKAIVLSVFLMTIGTAGIGVLPVNGHNIMLVVVLFVGFRLIQGLSAGGELSGMVTFISEVYANKRMVFYLSLLSLGIVIGMLLGSLSGQLAFSKHNFIHTNLWRLPFLSSILLGGAGVYLRLNALESPVFVMLAKNKEIVKTPIKETFLKHYKTIILITLMGFSVSSTFYYVNVFIPNFLHNELHFSAKSVVTFSNVGLFSLWIFIPIVGYVVPKHRVVLTLKVTPLVFAFSVVPFLFLIKYHPERLIYIMQVIFSLLLTPGIVLTMAFNALCFPSQIRYSALGLCSNLGIILGSASPFISQLFIVTTHNNNAPVLYIALIAPITTIALIIYGKKVGFTAALVRSPEKY